jgi:large repetitive protein
MTSPERVRKQASCFRALRPLWSRCGNKSYPVLIGTTTNYLWDAQGSLPQIVQDTSGSTTNTYLYGTGLILKWNGTAQTYYYPDALGSTRETRNGSGGLVSSYDYKAFGDILSQSVSGNNYFRYTGQQADDESGLYYLRARY